MIDIMLSLATSIGNNAVVTTNTRQRDTIKKNNNEHYSRRSNRQRGMFTNTRDTPMKKNPPINTRDQTDNVNEYCKKTHKETQQ